MKLLTAAERQVEQRGVSLLLVGPTGVGKTSQVKTLRIEVRQHPARRHRSRNPAGPSSPDRERASEDHAGVHGPRVRSRRREPRALLEFGLLASPLREGLRRSRTHAFRGVRHSGRRLPHRPVAALPHPLRATPRGAHRSRPERHPRDLRPPRPHHAWHAQSPTARARAHRRARRNSRARDRRLQRRDVAAPARGRENRTRVARDRRRGRHHDLGRFRRW